MKAILRLAVVCSSYLILAQSAFGNIVGYYQTILHPGVNLIANQFLTTPDSSLDTLFNTASTFDNLADNTAFTMWNNGAFLPTSYYDAGSDSWSINYNLSLGQGACLIALNQFTNTFVGSVGPYYDENSGNNVGWTPNYPSGMQLISNPTPIAGDLTYQFINTTGRNPVAGEGVAVLDPITQTYIESFFDGTSWRNQDLSGPSTVTIHVGEAAWYALGVDYSMAIPNPVPEPGTLTLVGLGAGLLVLRRRRLRV